MMNLKKIGFVLLSIVITANTLKADEGMWMLPLIQKLNIKTMSDIGFKLSAKDIYDINNSSLKDAVLQFGGGCTAEIISKEGLILTNHHCGYGSIQKLSSVEHNYLLNGFWAMNHEEEIPAPGLTVTFLDRFEDVTKEVTDALDSATDATKEEALKKVSDRLSNQAVGANKYLKGRVVSFYGNNQYYLIITKTYNDIRFVGAPPSSIGNFGKDTDNWVWPRHTGDFSMFRIYADKNNQPAEYSSENVPYIPKRSLKISMSGISEKDFTMVFGFPGRTTQYLPAIAVEQIRTVNDPAKIAIRDKALQVIDGFMRKDEGIKIQYAAKYASIQNAYKKWQGEVLGLTKTNANAKKLDYEKIFQQRVEANPAFANYKSLLQDLNTEYNAFKEYGHARDYYTEIMSKIELFTIASQLNALANAYESNAEKGYDARLKSVKAFIDGMIGEYNVNVDKKLFEALMPLYANEQAAVFVAPEFSSKLKSVNQNFSILANELYNQSDLYMKQP